MLDLLEIGNTLWYSLDLQSVFTKLESSSEGVSQQEAEKRLKKFGQNTLHTKKKENVLWIFFRQLHNPLIYILLVSSLLAMLLGKATDALVVLSVVVVNSVIGFIQEYRSSRTIEALLSMVPDQSTVIRNGISSVIPSSEIVIGDVILLQAGDRIAADIRLFFLKNLSCDESALTGESLPVHKKLMLANQDAAFTDRKCMAYSGTLVTSGIARGVVVATGLMTEFGKISELLEKVSPLETPLSHTLRIIAKWVTTSVFIIGAGVFVVGFFRGYSLLDAGLASIALAVAAIPEGLPAAITIAAAIGVQRMAKRNAIIRHMLAVETLGSTTIICTDKTGTLTQNEMTVQSIWTKKGSFFVTGIGYSLDGEISAQDSFSKKEELMELLLAGFLCNDASIEKKENELITSGDPTELALIVLAMKGKISEKIKEKWPRIDAIPFDSEKRFMATLHRTPSDKKIIFLKGAPEEVVKICKNPDPKIFEEVESRARQGMRVIALAKKEDLFDRELEEEVSLGEFELLGLLGMIDPARLEVPLAIKKCQSAGITVKMITGDHPLTATVIGSSLGLGHQKAITGYQLDQVPLEELPKFISENHIYARVLPEQKLKIVETLQASNHVVAMTGDGVNDAPALKRANIGIAMGISGTGVAKEASDMILADDNFASIESAVEEGRRVYDNLIKSIAFMFPTNLSQALVILVAILFFPIVKDVLLLPILPVQILWINLIVCVALTLPLAFETMEPDIMQRPPRKPKGPILSKFVWFRTIMVAALMTSGTIGLFLWEYFYELAKGANDQAAISNAQTIAVTTLVFFQIFYLFNCRSLRFSIFKIGFFSNLYVLLGIGLVVLTQIGFVYLPFMNTLFHSSSLEFKAWLISIGVASIILPLVAVEKWVLKKMRIT